MAASRAPTWRQAHGIQHVMYIGLKFLLKSLEADAYVRRHVMTNEECNPCRPRLYVCFGQPRGHWPRMMLFHVGGMQKSSCFAVASPMRHVIAIVMQTRGTMQTYPASPDILRSNAYNGACHPITNCTVA